MSFLRFLAISEGGTASTIADLRDWVWTQTERVRWTLPAQRSDWAALAAAGEISAIVVGLDGDESGPLALEIVEGVVNLPVVLVHPNQDYLEKLAKRACRKPILLSGAWRKSPEAVRMIVELLRDLGIQQSPENDVRCDIKDLGMKRTLAELGRGKLPLTQGDRLTDRALALAFAKYFDTKRIIRLLPVSGGWSGAPIVQFAVKGQTYYMKFFRDRKTLIEECKVHLEAIKWLEECGTKVRFIDELPPTGAGISEAFPEDDGVFPLCLYSASDGTTQRMTLDDLYQRETFEMVSEAVRVTIGVLGKQDGTDSEDLPPMDNPSHQIPVPGGQTFFLNNEERQFLVHESLHDLRRTLGQLDNKWKDREKAILDLIACQYPKWLTAGTPVRTGHIHGDLNTRNCLFSNGDVTDVRFIDLGGYRRDGFLVHDLSLLEASIKWSAMGAEQEPEYEFGDIDTRLLREASKIEAVAVEKGLAFTQDDLFAQLPETRRHVGCALTRAYSLVAIIRARARELSEGDPEGKHYMAALLSWNLRWLKLPHVRRVKKVLALYSSALILEKFQDN